MNREFITFKLFHFQTDADTILPATYKEKIDTNLPEWWGKNKYTVGIDDLECFQENVYMGMANFLKRCNFTDYRSIRSTSFKKVMNSKCYKGSIEFLKHINLVDVFTSVSGVESYKDGLFSKRYKLVVRPILDDIVEIRLNNYRNAKKARKAELYQSLVVYDLIMEIYNPDILDDQRYERLEAKKISNMTRSQRKKHQFSQNLVNMERDEARKLRLELANDQQEGNLKSILIRSVTKCGVYMHFKTAWHVVPVPILYKIKSNIERFRRYGSLRCFNLANDLFMQFNPEGLRVMKSRKKRVMC